MKAFSFFFFLLATVLLCLCKLMVMLGGVGGNFATATANTIPMKMSALILEYTLRKRKVVCFSKKHDILKSTPRKGGKRPTRHEYDHKPTGKFYCSHQKSSLGNRIARLFSLEDNFQMLSTDHNIKEIQRYIPCEQCWKLKKSHSAFYFDYSRNWTLIPPFFLRFKFLILGDSS